jgi:hypothetical protein
MPLSFDEHGLIPPRDHPMTFDELRGSVLVVGPAARPPTWDQAWRAHLVDNLELLVRQLWAGGISDIYVGGSFAQAIDRPGDIDGYFHCDTRDYLSRNLERRLNRIAGEEIWTWDQKQWAADGRGAKKIPMWHKYRVELWAMPPGQFSGITDRRGHNLPISEAFRQTRYGFKPRGMIKIEASHDS